MNVIKKNIGSSFGRNTHNYVKQGAVQKQAAQILFEFVISEIGDKKLKRVLEIGCGTGFLSEKIVNYFKGAQCFISDLSKGMIDANKVSIFDANDSIHHLVCDGEELPFSKDFKANLVVASMSLHWFQNFESSLKNLFEMTEMLAFSIPVLGSFKAWGLAHEKLGIKNRMIRFYSKDELEKILLSYKPKKFSIKIIELLHPVKSALGFLRHLKLIGASPKINLNSRTYTSGELKDLCREVDKYCKNDIGNYKIAICILEK